MMNSVLVIDKPAGMTSFDVVRMVRTSLGAEKAGHAGTLDPLATGVLTLMVNEAVKLTRFFEGHDKEYRATLRLGVETDTLDREGSVIIERPVNLSAAEIRQAVSEFAGDIEQTVPRYSAVKMQGRPLYYWTRKGVSVAPPRRNVTIHHITIESINLPEVTLLVGCSKGTYIRTLCSDIGNRLGCGAALFDLRRLSSGPFKEDKAVPVCGCSPEELRDRLKRNALSMTEALAGVAAVPVDDDTAALIRRGWQPGPDILGGHDVASLGPGDVIKFITFDQCMVALGRMLVSGSELATGVEERPVRIFRVINS